MKMAGNHSTEAIKSHGKMYWASLVACMFIASTTGGVYAFGTYSGALKKQYGGFTQGELDTVGLSPYFIAWLTWSTGMLCDRAGPILTTLLGVVLQTFAVVISWLVAADHLPHSLVPSRSAAIVWLCGASVVSFLGTSFETAAAFSTIVRRFPKQRGIVVGIAKGWVGITGGMVTQLFSTFVMIPNDTPRTFGFILTNGALAVVGNALAIALLLWDGEVFRWGEKRLCCGGGSVEEAVALRSSSDGAAPLLGRGVEESGAAVKDDDEATDAAAPVVAGGRFALMYAVLFGMCATVTASALAAKSMTSTYRIILGVAILAVWLAPLVLVLPVWSSCEQCERGRITSAAEDEAARGWKQRAQIAAEAEESGTTLLRAASSSLVGSTVGNGGSADPSDAEAVAMGGSALIMVRVQDGEVEVSLQKDVTLCQMLCTVECWLLYIAAAGLMGSGICITNNAAQMCEAKGFASATPVVVTVFSVAQASGRVIAGVLSEAAFVGRGKLWVPRPVFLIIASLMMMGAHALLLLPQIAALYAGVLVSGLAFGSVFPILVVLVSELFGLTNHGA